MKRATPQTTGLSENGEKIGVDSNETNNSINSTKKRKKNDSTTKQGKIELYDVDDALFFKVEVKKDLKNLINKLKVYGCCPFSNFRFVWIEMGFPDVILCEQLNNDLTDMIITAFYQTAIGLSLFTQTSIYFKLLYLTHPYDYLSLELLHESNDISSRVYMIYVIYTVFKTQPIYNRAPTLVPISYHSIDEIFTTATNAMTFGVFDPRLVLELLVDGCIIFSVDAPKFITNDKTDPIEQLQRNRLLNTIPSACISDTQPLFELHDNYKQVVEHFDISSNTTTFNGDIKEILNNLPLPENEFPQQKEWCEPQESDE
ncbi:hypothetical protein QTN25_009581 [Entamoeba marina]